MNKGLKEEVEKTWKVIGANGNRRPWGPQSSKLADLRNSIRDLCPVQSTGTAQTLQTLNPHPSVEDPSFEGNCHLGVLQGVLYIYGYED